jgi:hypothetical protein
VTGTVHNETHNVLKSRNDSSKSSNKLMLGTAENIRIGKCAHARYCTTNDIHVR